MIVALSNTFPEHLDWKRKFKMRYQKVPAKKEKLFPVWLKSNNFESTLPKKGRNARKDLV